MAKTWLPSMRFTYWKKIPFSSGQFDSGINTSAAWTVSLTNPDGSPRLSLNTSSTPIPVSESLPEEEEEEEEPQPERAESVDEEGSLDQEETRPARALYNFQGKAEFRELTSVEAGDELEIVREDVGEGWSLARLAGSSRDRDRNSVLSGAGSVGAGAGTEMGLIPRSYYIVSAAILASSTGDNSTGLMNLVHVPVHRRLCVLGWPRDTREPYTAAEQARGVHRVAHSARIPNAPG